MYDRSDPLNKFTKYAAQILETNGFAFSVRDDRKSIYYWGRLGFFHVRWIETLERDYWEVYSANHPIETFDDECKATRWINELIQYALEEENENV